MFAIMQLPKFTKLGDGILPPTKSSFVAAAVAYSELLLPPSVLSWERTRPVALRALRRSRNSQELQRTLKQSNQ